MLSFGRSRCLPDEWAAKLFVGEAAAAAVREHGALKGKDSPTIRPPATIGFVHGTYYPLKGKAPRCDLGVPPLLSNQFRQNEVLEMGNSAIIKESITKMRW